MTASALRAGRLSNDTRFNLWRTVRAGNRSQSAGAKETSRARECAMDYRAAAMGIVNHGRAHSTRARGVMILVIPCHQVASPNHRRSAWHRRSAVKRIGAMSQRHRRSGRSGATLAPSLSKLENGALIVLFKFAAAAWMDTLRALITLVVSGFESPAMTFTDPEGAALSERPAGIKHCPQRLN